MPNSKQAITILTVGDKKDFDSYIKFHKEQACFLKYGFKYATISYRRLLEGIVPTIDTKKIIIFLFFPYSYWNKNIEHKGYKSFYGGLSFFKKFNRFWNMVNKILKKAVANKEILFINAPLLSGLYRDKLSVIRKLERYNIQSPRLYKISGVKKIHKLINSGHNLYIKPRCGSMGKGITFLSRSNWKTNFGFKHNKIISRISDHNWKIRDITGNLSFLSKLIKNDVLIQMAIDHLVLKNYMLDLRIYIFFNKVIYIYPRKNRLHRIVTNISQGGQGDPSALKLLPSSQINKANKIASYVSRILRLNLCGIDFILDHNQKDVYLIDVNVFPGLPPIRIFNSIKHIAKELVCLSNRGGLHFEKSSDI